MSRKIPLLPSWLILLALFGTPLVRGVLAKRGLSPEQVSNLTVYFLVVVLLAAGVVLYRMRDRLPAPKAKPPRRWFLRRAPAAPSADTLPSDPH